MAVEMPQWCGRCDPTTRRFDLGDSERRCPDCNPFWAFGHSSVDPARVPFGHAEREQAARWLLYELVSLRTLDPVELRHRTRTFFDAGWTPLDIVHALDHDPDGSVASFVPAPGDAPDRVERKVLNLLAAWCDAHGNPLPSPSQIASVRRDRMRTRQRAGQAAWAEIAARPVDPEAAQRSGARLAAAQATRQAQEIRLAARRRERAARAASLDAMRAQEHRVESLMQRLSAYADTGATLREEWEADWTVRRVVEPVLVHDGEPAFDVEACEALPAAEPEAAPFLCEAEIEDAEPMREIALRVVRSRRNLRDRPERPEREVSPSVAENESGVGRPQWTSVRRSVGSPAGRSGGSTRRAA